MFGKQSSPEAKARGHKTGAGATVNPDSYGMFVAIAITTGVVFAVAVAASSFRLYHVGLDSMQLPPWAAWLPSAMLDAPILVFTGAAMAQKRRGRQFYRWFAEGLVAVFTAVSAFLAHGNSIKSGLDDEGVFLYTIAPIIILASTMVLVQLVTKAPPAPRATTARKAPAKKKAPTRRPAAAKAQQTAPVELVAVS